MFSRGYPRSVAEGQKVAGPFRGREERLNQKRLPGPATLSEYKKQRNIFVNQKLCVHLQAIIRVARFTTVL